MAGAVLTRSRGAVRGLPTSLTADATPEPEVSGSTDDPEVFRRQVSRVFERFEEVLAASGLCPRHITRTWFFIARIHDRYPIFNEVRDAYFDAWDLRGFPASTGIGAALQAGVGIVGALDALDGAEVREVNTVHQPAPRSYGPRFVRANTFDLDGLRVLNISGISSIDDQGRSLATGGDDELDHCLGSFVDLLSGAGMTPQDVRSLYLYASAPEVGRRLVTRARGLGLPEPTLVNYSDICRPDLRVEIEGRAVRPVL